jgi:dihydrodipicolinate synthase/N-acetylneuraminate lyase
VKRIRFAKKLGAEAMLLGIPMWQPATLEMAVAHYAGVSELFPDFPVMVYCNSRAFRFPFGLDFWQGIAQKAPTVIAAKFSQASIIDGAVEATKGRVSFISTNAGALPLAEACPDAINACWTYAMGLNPSLALIDAILAKDWERAHKVADDMKWAGEAMEARHMHSPEIFASYNIQFARVQMEASGYCNPGPVRPPYNFLPADYEAACREQGERWAQLQQKYAPIRTQ